jgi:hypothetical protein
MQEPEPLRSKLCTHDANAGDVAVRPVEARHDTRLDRIPAGAKNDWNSAGQSFDSEWRSRPDRSDDGHPATNKIGGQFREAIEFIVCPSIFDRKVATLDITGFA